MSNAHEDINNLILEEGFKQASQGEWESQLTGEETTSTLLDAILTASGVGGMLAKGRKGLQLIPKAQWNKVFGSKVVDKASEGVRQLALAMKGKIKDGKLIPNQPFKQGMIGKPSGKTPATKFDWEKKLEELVSRDSRTKIPLEKPSFDVGGWKNVAPAQAKKIQSKDKGKWGLAGLLGLLGLTQDDQGSYVGEDSSQEMPSNNLSQILQDITFSDMINKLIPNPDMSGAGDMPNDALMNVLRNQLKETDQDYYEGETPIGLEELAKIIQEEEQEEIINYPQNLSNRARSWAK